MHALRRACAPLLLVASLAALGCGATDTNPNPAPVKSTKAETPAKAPAADAKKSPPKSTRAVAPSTLDVKKAELSRRAAEPLTEEEKALIDADPKTLPPEKRRERAYALRKKIMQNPDSPAAQELERVRKMIESGELTPQLPGHPPVGSDLTFRSPAGAPTKAVAPTQAGDAPAADAKGEKVKTGA